MRERSPTLEDGKAEGSPDGGRGRGGHLLHKVGKVDHSKQAYLSSVEVIQQNNGACPNCGRKLAFDPREVEAKVSAS